VLELALGGRAAQFAPGAIARSSTSLALSDARKGPTFDVTNRSALPRRREKLFLDRLRAGPDGTKQTTDRMAGIVRDAVYDPFLICRRAAEQIVQRTPGGDRVAEMRALFRWIFRHVRYTRDPGFLEYLQDPRALLFAIDTRWLAFGDCDDHAMLMATLCWMLRIPTVFVLTARRSDADFGHVYAAAQLPDDSNPRTRALEDQQHAAWLTGDSGARSGLLCLDTAASDAEFGVHPDGDFRTVVSSIA
jgi:transglutaminase-like putative cysteine protease